MWATRSPFRPNRIGLSVVRLDRVVMAGEGAPCLEVSGLDLVDGTPILDVKPYVPYADRVEGATAGFADEAPERLEVQVGEEAREKFEELVGGDRAVILETLSLDGRPAYHEGRQEERVYYTKILDWEISWEVREGVCFVVEGL